MRSYFCSTTFQIDSLNVKDNTVQIDSLNVKDNNTVLLYSSDR
jgi:hypothetical protein